MSEREFWGGVIAQNYPEKVNHAIILRDKYLFAVWMKAHGLPHPEVVGFANAGRFFVGNTEYDWMQFCETMKNQNEALFVKDATSCCARGVTKVAPGEWPFEESDFASGKFIVQRAVENHPKIAAIQPNSVNTLRIVTVYVPESGKIELLSPGGLRVGGGGDVDNWAAGGLFVGMDESGRLGKYGFYKPVGAHDGKSAANPQTGFVFEDEPIPFYGESVKLVKRAHSTMPELRTIGWDIAVTHEGAVIIEGNDDWEISLMQIVAGGLRERCVEFGLLR